MRSLCCRRVANCRELPRCVILLLPQMLEWANEFGGVFKFSLGFQWVVVVSDPAIAVEVGPDGVGRCVPLAHKQGLLQLYVPLTCSSGCRPRCVCTESPSYDRTYTCFNSGNACSVPNVPCAFRWLQVLGRGPRSIPRKCIGYKFFDLVSDGSGRLPRLQTSHLVT